MKNALKTLSFFRNVVFLKWASQIVFLVGLLYIIWSYIQNAVVNLEQTNIAFSWGWLGETPGVSIAEGMYTLPNSGRQMIQVGMLNMLRVTVTGIFAATFLGTFLGIARLSKNYIVEKTSTGLLEVVRNVPLLVQIFFFQAFVLTFPRLEVFDVGTYYLHVSAKGIAFPWLNRQPTAYLFWVYLLAIFILANKIYKWRVQILEREGRETRPFLWSVGIFFGLLVAGWYGGYRVMGVIGFLAGFISTGVDLLPAIFKIILNVIVVLLVVVLMFSSVGLGLSNFLVGDEIVFKADWGVPQFFDGVNNKLYWNPEAKIVLDAQLDGMKRADIIDWIAVPGTEVTKGDVIARATAKDLKGDLNQEISIYAKYTGVIEEVFVSQGDTIKINEKTYDIRVTDSKPLELSRPRIEQIGTTKFKRYADGFGKSLSVGYFAIWLGVVLYTAIFISEVVRAGIMAVSKGQSEAGLSLGLGRGALLRLIVLPQAIRVMLPPMGNQYLNLAKNTSLGIAVAYPEIVAVGQTLYNQEGQTLPVFLFWMAFYSTVSLTISTIINYYNRKMKIVER